MADQQLPENFSDLEPWLGWSLATERERNARRQASNMEDIRAFYDGMLARMDEVLGYLEQFPLDSIPPDAQRLFYLTLSLAEVAPAAGALARRQQGRRSVAAGRIPEKLEGRRQDRRGRTRLSLDRRRRLAARAPADRDSG